MIKGGQVSKKNTNPAYGAHLMPYAGIPTCMRQPASRELKGVDVAIVGIPFDSGASSFRSGTRFWPTQDSRGLVDYLGVQQRFEGCAP